MRCFRSSIFVLLLVSLTLTGCVGGGGGKGYTVSGKVIDENGKGIAGVEIAVAGGKVQRRRLMVREIYGDWLNWYSYDHANKAWLVL